MNPADRPNVPRGTSKEKPGRVRMFLRGDAKLRAFPADKSQHNTLRFDQVERRRKAKRRAAAKLPRYRYRKTPPELCESCGKEPKRYRGDKCVRCDIRLDHGPVSRALGRLRA